jgi:hypothetical protein
MAAASPHFFTTSQGYEPGCRFGEYAPQLPDSVDSRIRIGLYFVYYSFVAFLSLTHIWRMGGERARKHLPFRPGIIGMRGMPAAVATDGYVTREGRVCSPLKW